MAFRLVVETGEQKGAAFSVGDGVTLVGRSHSADIRLSQSDVSGCHVRITRLNNEIVVENLSRFGTVLEGKQLSEPVAMQPGQRLKLGAHMVLVLEEIQDSTDSPGVKAHAQTSGVETMPLDGATGSRDTFAGTADGTRGSAQLKTSESWDGGPVPSRSSYPETGSTMRERASVADSQMDWASGTYDSAEMEDDRTRELKTRVPAPDEMMFLKEGMRRRARNRVFLLVGIVVVLLAGLGIFWPRKKPPEDTISWPQDSNGVYLEATRPSLLGGLSLIYPDCRAELKEMDDNRIVVKCLVGRERDVPLIFVLDEKIDAGLAAEDRDNTVEGWQDEAARSEGEWIFDKPLEMEFFLGKESGIPVVMIPYRRIENESWCGTVRLIRSGTRLITLRTEVPASERARMDELLYTLYLEPTNEFLRGHWEGSSDIGTALARSLVNRAERELRRDAPSSWVEVQAMLFEAIREASVKNDAKLVQEATQLLIKLRGKQAIWFNARLLERKRLLSLGDESTAEINAGSARAVFNDRNDRRYYVVRRW